MIRRILKIVGNVILYVLAFTICYLPFLVLGIIFGLINDTAQALILLGVIVLIAGLGWGAHTLHSFLLRKIKIDWDNYKDLKYVAKELVGITITITLGFLIILLLTFFSWWLPSYEEMGEFVFIMLIIFLPPTIFSIWTYLALVFAKKNALLLIRTYFIFILFLEIFSLFVCIILWYYNDIPFALNNNIVYLIIICVFYVIARFIKAVIITFTAKYIKPLKNQQVRVIDIFLILILCCFSYICLGRYIYLGRLDIETQSTSNVEYPALNQSK